MRQILDYLQFDFIDIIEFALLGYIHHDGFIDLLPPLSSF